jgi:hypothetical protein
MTYKTVPGTLNPDGTLILPGEHLPAHAVPVMVTILEPEDAGSLAELGDYQQELLDYEERLARGEIRWQ